MRVGTCRCGWGHVVAGGDMSLRAGTFDAIGDGNPVPVRVGCPRLERIAPGHAECPCYCEKRGGRGCSSYTRRMRGLVSSLSRFK